MRSLTCNFALAALVRADRASGSRLRRIALRAEPLLPAAGGAAFGGVRLPPDFVSVVDLRSLRSLVESASL
jgi:hypothetical protein